MNQRIVIIDGNSLINRAYYAMQRPMITKEGIYTQGIYGFINMLNKIEADYAPEYMAVAWDRKTPTFRHEEYKEYKAGRKKMPPELAMELPLMKEILSAMGVENLEIDGFEADDIIGTIARIAEEEGLSPLIITGDKDALQLASDITHVLITKKGISEFDLYDREKMIERYQLTPQQFIDLKGLMGDQSDNIPGIPGVGEKTGIKLLTQFGSITELLARTDEIASAKLRAKVEENAQLAVMSRRLAEINRFVPLEIDIEKFRVTEPDYETLISLYVKLEFNSFLKKLHIEDKPAAFGADFDSEESYERKEIAKPDELTAIEEIPAGARVIIKVFSDNSHIQRPQLFGIGLLYKRNFIYVNLTNDRTKAGLIKIMKEKSFSFSGHDLIADYYALILNGLTEFSTVFDTAVAQYVLEPTRSGYPLKGLVFENLHYEIPDEAEVLAGSGQMDLLGGTDANYAEFAFLWTLAVERLSAVQEKRLAEEELTRVYEEAELPLIQVLAHMEAEGFDVNRQTLQQYGKVLKDEITGLEKQIFALAGEEFNLNSPFQLGDILFEKLQLPSGKKTKRGYSTSADILEKIRDKHPIIELVLQYRTLTKLNSTYVEGLAPLIGRDGRIRAHFRQTVTATGRISCTEPNLQNIPIRQELGRQLRKAFVSGGDNYTLVGADYSQIELRILAHLSGDENLIAAFNAGDDIHRNTAARVFNLKEDEVTPLDRSRAKAVNFGVIYGMSGFGLSENLHITRNEAQQYINDYFDKHRAVKAYMDGQVESCRKEGFTKTILGRKRYIHEISASNFMTRQLGERLAMNSPIQGSAADIIKLAMIKVHRELTEKGYASKLILQVHDELIIRTRLDELEAVKELLVRNMQSAISLAVKLESDLNQGDTWYDLK